jgi:hypothetical protein
MFKSLDTLFPVTPNRDSGEVVNVGIRVFVDNVDLGEISMKRKAWYVNTSVNAFHMHRSLVRDFVDTVRGLDLSPGMMKRAKRLITLAVLHAYLVNRETDQQELDFHLNLEIPSRSLGMWYDDQVNHTWKQVRDVSFKSLRDLVDGSVEDFKLIGGTW